MSGRPRLLVLPCAALAVALAAALLAAAVGQDALTAVPALILLVPLIAGRYVGEEQLTRLLRRAPAPVRRAQPALLPPRPRRRAMARGGRLIGVSLARREPPRTALAR